MALREPTRMHRVVVDELGRCFIDGGEEPAWHVVGPEPAARGERMVRVYLPSDPPVSIALDRHPKEEGYRRPYHWPEPETGSWLRFRLQPTQVVSAVSHRGFAQLVVVIEYPDNGKLEEEVR